MASIFTVKNVLANSGACIPLPFCRAYGIIVKHKSLRCSRGNRITCLMCKPHIDNENQEEVEKVRHAANTFQ